MSGFCSQEVRFSESRILTLQCLSGSMTLQLLYRAFPQSLSTIVTHNPLSSALDL